MVLAFAPAAGPAQVRPDDSARPSTVSSVTIRRESVFDSTETSNWFFRGLNSIHIVTRERIIARELLLKEGGNYDSASAAETERNLRKLGIFREVTIDSVRADTGLAAIITTRDSWTTQPYLTFKTVGSQVTWGVGATEKNLLGLQISATIRYINDPDRSSIGFAAILPKMWRDQLSIGGGYASLSDGTRARFLAQVPYASLSAPRSMQADYEFGDRHILRFFDGEAEASDTLRQLMHRGTGEYSWAVRATPDGYVRLRALIEVRRENYVPLGTTPERSVFGELGFTVEALKSKYAVVREYRNLGGAEDVDMSPTVRVGLWVAPSGWGYDRFGVGPALTLSGGKELSNGFVTGKIKASGLFTSAGLDSGTVIGDFVGTIRPREGHSIVLGVNVGADRNPYPGEEFDLGSSFGPRAYPLHSFTGDRMFFTSAEYRMIAMPRLWNLFAVGFAAFADYGGAWFSSVDQRRTGTDLGVGLRLGSIRGSSGGKATRIDLARRFANDAIDAGWVIVVGAGFTLDRPQKVARQ
jgi:hypothetical protein